MLNISFRRPSNWQILIGLLLLLGFALRLFDLNDYPLAGHHDELSNIYDGYCIAETGADRWGAKFPLILRAFGNPDYRPPMYAWLCAVPIKVFGFSMVTGRIISALAGCASLVLLYLVARRMGGRQFAAFALLLAVLSPWHIIFSRIASEGTMLPPFFLILACWLWQRAYDRHYAFGSLVLLGLSIGLGTNTYQATKLVSVLLGLWVVIDLLRRADKFLLRAAMLGLGCVLGAAPQLAVAITQPKQFFSRADGSMMAFSWSYQYLNQVLNHISLNLSPEFLFFSFGKYNFLSIGRLLLVEVAVFYIGLVLLGRVVNRQQAIRPVYFYLLLLTAILPSALTAENPHALRASDLTVLLPLVSAAGLCVVYRAIQRPALRKAFVVASVGLILWNSIYYSTTYAESYALRNDNMQSVVRECSTKLQDYRHRYDAILLEEFGGQMYIYVAMFGGMSPEEFQRADKLIYDWSWDEVKKLDNVYFVQTDQIPAKLQELPGKKLLIQRQRNEAYKEVDWVEVNGEMIHFYEIDSPR